MEPQQARQRRVVDDQPTRLVLVSTLAMACGTLMLFVVSALSPFLTAEFGISGVELGLVSTAMYTVAVIGTPVAGWLTDRIAPERLVMVLFVLAGGSVAGLAAASSYVWILVVVSIAGVPLAISHPATNALVLRGVDRTRHGTAVGLKQAGVQGSAMMAGFGLPVAAALVGWRSAALAFGVLMLAPLLVMGGGTAVGAPADVPEPEQRSGYLNRSTVLVATFGVLMSVSVASLLIHLPRYLQEVHAMAAGRAGMVVGAVGLGGLLGRLLLGRLLDGRMSVTGMLLAVAAGACASLLMIIRSGGGPELLVWVGAFVFGLTGGAWPSVAMVAVLRYATAESAGRASSVVLGPSFSSFIFAPALVGLAVDATGSYTRSFVAVLAALVMAVAAAAALRWWPAPAADYPSTEGR